MIGKLKFQDYKDWSKGTWQDAQNSIAPKNSCKLGLNLNSDEEIGSLVSRKGTTIVGSQIIDGKDVLGLHNYRDSLGTGDKLFAAVSDGNNTDIYDVETGTKSLQDDTHPLSISISPSVSKSYSPSSSISPSKSPSASPSVSPSAISASPSISPSRSPSSSLSTSPSVSPSVGSRSPSSSPSLSPSSSPSLSLSISPSSSPSISPSHSPGDVNELFYTSLYGDANLKAYYRFENNCIDSSQNGYTLDSNGTVDVTSYGSITADSFNGTGYEASKAIDNNSGTSWSSANTSFPHWLKMDYGVGVTKIINKITILPLVPGGGSRVKNFTLYGSNNDSDYTSIGSGLHTNAHTTETFTFSNATTYRYYKIIFTDNYDSGSPNFADVEEIEMMESPSYESGKFGNSAYFGESNNSKSLYASIPCTSNISVSIWFYQSSAQSGKAGLFSCSGGVSGYQACLWINTDNSINIGAWTANGNEEYGSPVCVINGAWNHIVGTWSSGGYETIYVNGVQVYQHVLVGSIKTDNTVMGFGRDFAGSSWLSGYIDDAAIFDRLLSPTEISNLYNGLLGSSSASPSLSPSISKSNSPSSSLSPSLSPSKSSSVSPSVSPSTSPPNSFSPSISASISPSVSPPQSESPSISPSVSSSLSPSLSSSISPSLSPSMSQSLSPSASASMSPSVSPSVSPSITSYEGLKTRFLTYLNSCLRLNGINKPKAYNGSSWIDTGGVFDLDSLPQASKYAIEFKDRVYVAGKSDSPDQVDISSIANATTRAISWDTADGAKFIVFEQEDGGGGITGLWKVPGYIIVGKKRTIKRYDGSSAYPEDMVNQGIPTQECGITAQGMLFWVNENGAWASEGAKPKKISTYTVDKIIKSCSDFMWVSAGTDEEHIFFSFPSVTISGENYTNVVLKYNIFQNTWDVRKYPTHHTCHAKYVDEEGISFTVIGDNDGTVRKLDTGNSDDGTGITYALETQDIDFGMRGKVKKVSDIDVLTENVSKGTLMYRTTHEASDWKSLGKIDKEAVNITKSIRGRYFNFKLSETVNSGQAKIIGLEFPSGIEVHD
jgi:hypothetical protein